MASLSCREFHSRLEPWMEGECATDARVHLQGCPACRAVVEDLEALKLAAQDIAAAEPEPPAHLWTSLRAQLVDEGLIKIPSSVERSAWMKWLRGVLAPIPRPVVAGAYVAVLVAVAFGLSGPIHRRVNDYRWISGNQTSSLGATLASEQTTVASFRDNPVVTASFRKNLEIVDNYIALCEKSVREEPQNELARDYLYTAYQQKADLLEQMAERGDYIR
jgi:hypothetical protein